MAHTSSIGYISGLRIMIMTDSFVDIDETFVVWKQKEKYVHERVMVNAYEDFKGEYLYKKAKFITKRFFKFFVDLFKRKR